MVFAITIMFSFCSSSCNDVLLYMTAWLSSRGHFFPPPTLFFVLIYIYFYWFNVLFLESFSYCKTFYTVWLTLYVFIICAARIIIFTPVFFFFFFLFGLHPQPGRCFFLFKKVFYLKKKDKKMI